MRVLYFNVGETEMSTSPIARYAMDEIDHKEMREAIAARENGYGGPIYTTGEIKFKDGEVFYKKQFLCYAKDLFVRHLTQDGRQKVIESAIPVCDMLKGEKVDNIFMYMPTQMDHDEVASIVYNICWENGQLLNENNIIHDDRIAEYADFKAASEVKGSKQTGSKKEHEKGVLAFLKELAAKHNGKNGSDIIILIGGNDLYKMLTTSKKTKKYCEAPHSVVYGAESSDTPDKYCLVDAIEAGKDLAPGEVVPMYIEQPKSAIERIFG